MWVFPALGKPGWLVTLLATWCDSWKLLPKPRLPEFQEKCCLLGELMTHGLLVT